MTALFDQVRWAWKQAVAPLRRWPLLLATLHLLFALALYGAGGLAVQGLSGDARMPVLVYLVFFLPGVLRPWLNLYWQVRADLRGLRRRHERAGAH